MTHLLLSHLSQNNNSPELVEELFTQHAGDVKMIIASRYQETEVYHIATANSFTYHQPVRPTQMELFY
jgi:hypothetical protein